MRTVLTGTYRAVVAQFAAQGIEAGVRYRIVAAFTAGAEVVAAQVAVRVVAALTAVRVELAAGDLSKLVIAQRAELFIEFVQFFFE